jgi:hypothetical protein
MRAEVQQISEQFRCWGIRGERCENRFYLHFENGDVTLSCFENPMPINSVVGVNHDIPISMICLQGIPGFALRNSEGKREAASPIMAMWRSTCDCTNLFALNSASVGGVVSTISETDSRMSWSKSRGVLITAPPPAQRPRGISAAFHRHQSRPLSRQAGLRDPQSARHGRVTCGSVRT